MECPQEIRQAIYYGDAKKKVSGTFLKPLLATVRPVPCLKVRANGIKIDRFCRKDPSYAILAVIEQIGRRRFGNTKESSTSHGAWCAMEGRITSTITQRVSIRFRPEFQL